MKIFLNGDAYTLKEQSSISDLLTLLNLNEKEVLVEHNQKALFPREFSSLYLETDDCVEIINVVAGG